MRQREDGTVLAYSKSDGSCYVFPRSEYPRLLADWMAGKAFFTGPGFYGGKTTVKLGDVVCVADTPPEAIRARADDDRANAREDAIDT